MALFGNKQKTRHVSKPRDPARMEQLITVKEKQDESKRKIAARNRASELVKGDPEAERAYISDMLGITLKPPDPDLKIKQEIKSLLTAEALATIQSDPGLKKELARRQVDIILGQEAIRPNEDGDGYTTGSPLDQVLSEIDTIDEVRKRLGGGRSGEGGILSAFTDPEVLKAIFGFLSNARGQGSDVQPQQLFVISVDGKPTSVSRSQYDKLLQTGKLQPIAALITEKTEGKGETKVASPSEDEDESISPIVSNGTPPAPQSEYKELPEFLKDTDFSAAEEWLDYKPEEFIPQLKAEVDKGVKEAQLLWGFLTTATYEGIVNMITPYRTNPKVSILIEELLSDEGKVWIESVLQLVKEASSGRPD